MKNEVGQKDALVGYYSGTVAIDGFCRLNMQVFCKKNLFPFFRLLQLNLDEKK
jgi:hypothetical protein